MGDSTTRSRETKKKLAYSTDGENWTNLYGPMMTSPVYLMNDCWSIASGMCSGTLTIEVSSVADNVYSFNRSPPDGLWQYGSLPVLSEWVVAYGNNGFVAVGPNTNAYTTNGDSWHSAHSISGNWSSIAYGNGTFVALQSGSATAEYTINPASGWTSCSMPVSDNWSGIAWNSNLFVAIASGSTNAAYSPDGINWTLSSTGLPVSDSWACVAAGAALALPVITNEPAGIATLPAFSPTFSVGATSTYALGYQWLFDGTNIAGATNSSYTLVNVQSNDVGSYAVVVTNIYGSVTGSVATLTLNGYITNGLVAWWRMADQSGTTAMDWSGNGNTLPLINSPSWGSNYLIFSAVSNQYGDAGSNALTSLDNHDMTICAWINQTSNSVQGIIDKSYYGACSNSIYGGWSLFVDDGQLYWTLQDCYNIADSGPGVITPGQWMFVSAVWQSPTNSVEQVSYYINGLPNSTVGASAAAEHASGLARLEVGNYENNFESGAINFDGLMRDVAVYNRPLSSNEILANFLTTASATNVPFPDLLYYAMTEAGKTSPTPVTLLNSATDAGISAPTNGTMYLPSGSSNKPPEWHGGLGSVSNGLHFNGSYSYLDSNDTNNFNFTTNSFTVNLWVRPYGPIAYLFGNNTYRTDGWCMLEGYNNIGVVAETTNGEVGMGMDNVLGNWPAGPTPYPYNWNMVTVTRDGTNLPTIYIDALPVAVSGAFTNPIASANPLTFGYGVYYSASSNIVATNYYDGDIWQPQIWSGALGAAQIYILYTNQITGTNWPPISDSTNF